MARLKSELVNGEWVNVPFTAEEDAAADAMAIAAAPMEAEHEALRQRDAAFKGESGRQALVNRLRTATPQQIETYFQGRTTLAQLKQDLVDIVKVLALEVRD